jgi:hypothetical protein
MGIKYKYFHNAVILKFIQIYATAPLLCFQYLGISHLAGIRRKCEPNREGTVGQAREEQTAADNVIYKLLQEGLALKLAESSASPLSNGKSLLITVPVTLSLSDQIVEILSEAIKTFHGTLDNPEPIIFIREVSGTKTLGNHLIGNRLQNVANGARINFSNDAPIEQYFREQIGKMAVLLSWTYTDGEADSCSISNVEIKRLLPAQQLKITEPDQDLGHVKGGLFVATLPPFSFTLEPLRPDIVLLIFSKASFQVERELAVSSVERLKGVTGKVVIGSEEDKAGAKCKISKITKNNSIEDAQSNFKELLPLMKRYKQAAGSKD